MGSYPHFILPMRSSRGFASAAADTVRPVRTRFRFGSTQDALNLQPGTASRRIIMQKARGQALLFLQRVVALPPLLGVWFQVQCPPLVGVLPIVRSRYFFAIGRQRVLSLAGWAPPIQTGFLVAGLTQVPNHRLWPFAYGAFTR